MQDHPDSPSPLPDGTTPPPTEDAIPPQGDDVTPTHVEDAIPPQGDDVVIVEDSSLRGGTARKNRTRRWLWFAAAVTALGVIVLLGYLAAGLAGARSDVEALRRDVADLQNGAGAAGDRLADVDTRLADLDVWLTAMLGSSPSQAIPANGDLPAFEQTANDLAVLAGMTLPTIEGPEYYSDTTVTYQPDDGTARVWLVWAHWCPHCQAELPELATWYTENAGRFPTIELVTVTTAIDESSDNPLIPYLDDSAFPFPVIVDGDGTQASHFGATVFPFWVITDPHGEVLVRIGGELDMAQVEEIFSQLTDLAAGA